MSLLPTAAVVGCGYWGKNLVRALAQVGGLSAVCDPNVDVASRVAEQYGVAAVAFSDLLIDPDLDALVIAAPAAQHTRLVTEGLRAGKHVFVEKPLALDLREGEGLCALAEENDLVLMVGHLMQYHPAFSELRRRVHEGDLGRLRYVYSNRLNLGKFRREENILWSFAPHDISMILELIGSIPDEVSAVGSSYLHKTIADVTTTHMSFPGGEKAHVYVSWLHPVKEQKLVVVGDVAMAVFDDTQPWESKLVLYRHKVEWRKQMPEAVRAEPEYIEIAPVEPLRVECEHFLGCVRDGTRPRTDGREGLAVLRVLDSAERSMSRAPHTGPSTRRHPGVQIHESAYVDEPVEIGEGTKIWHFSHVLRDTRIGRDCSLGQNVMIGPDVTVGDRCKIQNNVSIYKGVTLEDDVFCGPSCVFTNVINPRSEIERRDEFLPTLVGHGASIGANATIVCGNTIGHHAFVAAGAVVTRDVLPHALVAGVPARQLGWMSHAGARLGDDLVCRISGRTYELRAPGELIEVTEA